ncbi:MAG: PP2C family serine/threonine-protein phosphatase [Magnetospirillum sp.]
MRFVSHTLSRAGGRSVNQDRVLGVENARVVGWLLADGLGGHGGGEVAAQAAVNAAAVEIQNASEYSLALPGRILARANDRVIEGQTTGQGAPDMRSTLVLMISDGERLSWAWIGDSRFYAFRDGRVLAQSKDHSVPQKLVEAGQIRAAEIRNHPDRNRLLRALGSQPQLATAPKASQMTLSPGDALLLCSDGFWEFVTELEMEVDLAKSTSPEQWVSLLEDRLLQRVDESKSTENDNYSAVAVFALKNEEGDHG